MKRITFLLLGLFMLSVAVAQTGYRIVHPDGTVEFTDDPTKGGEEVELREAPTFKPSLPTYNPDHRAQQPQSSSNEVGFSSITIISPQSEQTVWFDGSGVTVSVQTVPALKAPYKVVISMDHKEVASGSSSSFTLGNVERGAHTLQAVVIDSQGNIQVSSDAVVFYMRRRTVIKP